MYSSQLQKTPLHRASSGGHTTTVQLLLNAKADISAKDDVSTAALSSYTMTHLL